MNEAEKIAENFIHDHIGELGLRRRRLENILSTAILSYGEAVRREQREADAKACRKQQHNAIRLRDSLRNVDENEQAAAKEIDLGQHYLGEMADRILNAK